MYINYLAKLTVAQHYHLKSFRKLLAVYGHHALHFLHFTFIGEHALHIMFMRNFIRSELTILRASNVFVRVFLCVFIC